MQRAHSHSSSHLAITGNRKTTLWLLSAACLVGLAGTGCDQVKDSESSVRKADRRVSENLAKGGASTALPLRLDKDGKFDANDVSKRSKTLVDALTAAANEAGASSEAKLRAKSDLARVELAQALKLVPEIDRHEQQLSQILWDMRQGGVQIEATHLTAANFVKADPNTGSPAPQTALDEQAAAIKVAMDKADADAKAISIDLEKRKADIESLKAEKATADSEADTLVAKSEAAKGKESLDLFNQSMVQRQKGGELAAKIEVATLSLLPIESSLAVAQQQKLVWDNKSAETPGAVQGLASQKLQVDAAWADRRAGIDAAGKAAQTVVVNTFTPKSADLVKEAAEIRAVEDDAAAKFRAAAKHFGEAADACKALGGELNTKISDPQFQNAPQREAWKNLIKVCDENYFRLQQAGTLVQLGEMELAHANQMSQRKTTADQLATSVKDSGVSVPAEIFPEAAASELSGIRTDGTKDLESAEKILDAIVATKLTGEDAEAVRNAAHILAIQARMSRMEATDDADAKGKIKDALTIDKVWVTEKTITLPPAINGKL